MITSCRTTHILACALLLVPAAAGAQAVNGSAEWAVAQNSSASDSQQSTNSALWQNYSLGYSSVLWDRRIATYSAEGLFRTSQLKAGTTAQPDQRGRQDDLGYRLATSLFADSAFPFYVQATRVNTGSSGELAPSTLLSGLVVPTGTPPPDVNSLNTLLNVGGQLNLGKLPRVQVGYRKSGAVVTGGSYLAEQHTEDVSANVTKDTLHTRHSLRYQRSFFDNFLSERFAQHLNNLDYDFEATLGAHTRLLAHNGWRSTFSESAFSAPIVADPVGAPYKPPPSIGAGETQYAMVGLDYEPNARLSVRTNGSFDWQTAANVTTNARLATVNSRYELVRGLSVDATAIGGTRQQVVGESMVTVATRTGIAGVTYQGGPHWLYATVGTTRGAGTNQTPDGKRGRSDSWTRQADLSSTVRWLGLGVGYERVMYRDEILEFGNYNGERIRASVQVQGQRVTVSTNGDRARIDRGQGATFSHNLQDTASLAASWRVWREGLLTATGGGFSNIYTDATGPGRDRSLFWSLSGQMPIRETLRLTGWVRKEEADAQRTRFNQRGLSSFAQAEYRLRTTRFTAEYRRNDSRSRYVQMPSPDNFRGRQVRFSITRVFGFRV